MRASLTNTLRCLAAALALASSGPFAALLPDTDGDGVPDALEANEQLSWVVKDNDIFNRGRLFAMQQYRDFLRREGDPAGVAYWTQQVDGNTIPRDRVIFNFLMSDEFSGRLPPVVRLYQAYFKRPPDLAGLLYWSDRYASGTSIYEISDAFAASAEFQAQYGSKSNAEFMQLLFFNVFDRQPDPAGYTFWLGELDANRRSRGNVMVQFSESPEFQQKSAAKVAISLIYAGMLQRAPDPAGFNYWVGVLGAGGNAFTMIDSFFNSLEYKNRFVSYFQMAANDYSVDAARFLAQATFGPRSLADIVRVQQMGYDLWIQDQMAKPTASQVQFLQDAKLRLGREPYEDESFQALWQQWLTGDDQLRARVAFALSEIMVISDVAPNLNAWGMSYYMDMLNANAFGNYRTLLGQVATHPAMGYYLNMLGSEKEDPAKMRNPNQNFAREVMQLFSIGLNKLNIDGTLALGADGKPQPTYDENTVLGFAKAFSGWSWGGANTADTNAFYNAPQNWLVPMAAWPALHSTSSKTLLNGVVLNPGGTPWQDLDDALDNIFFHPNVGPFICREMIQRLVTSNPSKGQIQRCATTFNNNGLGERGSLKSIVREILLDPDARDVTLARTPTFGKQREPVIRFANMLRAFGARSPTGRNSITFLDSPDDGLGQSPLLAPSVFNFFSPNYKAPGVIAQNGLFAPEFQITTETSVVGTINFFAGLVDRGFYGWDTPTQLTLDYSLLQSLAGDPAMLADHINMLLMAGSMSPQTRASIVKAVGAIAASKTRDRVEAAVTIASFSADFVIQK